MIKKLKGEGGVIDRCDVAPEHRRLILAHTPCTYCTMTTPVTITPERATRARVAPNAPRYEGGWRAREESPGAPKPLFRLDVPVATPVATPAAARKIIQRCNMPQDECGVFCIFDSQALYPDIPGECPLCRSTGIEYIFGDVFDAEPDRSKHVWCTWDELGVSTPGWVIGNLANLDWDDADASWSHEEDAEEEPEEEEEEVDEQEDLYDDYDGEHDDYPCDD